VVGMKLECPICGAPLWALIITPGYGCDECGYVKIEGGEKK